MKTMILAGLLLVSGSAFAWDDRSMDDWRRQNEMNQQRMDQQRQMEDQRRQMEDMRREQDRQRQEMERERMRGYDRGNPAAGNLYR